MSGRIQAKPNVVHGFCLTMRAMGKSAVYTLPIRVPFSATFYDFRDDDFVSRSCPYVARVEISDPIPVPPVGMLNITIANPSGTPVRMLMVRSVSTCKLCVISERELIALRIVFIIVLVVLAGQLRLCGAAR